MWGLPVALSLMVIVPVRVPAVVGVNWIVIKQLAPAATVVPQVPALAFWRDGLGLAVSHLEEVPSQKARVAFLPTGESEIAADEEAAAERQGRVTRVGERHGLDGARCTYRLTREGQ